MHAIYFLVRIYPYWAFALALALLQLAIYFRRRKKNIQYSFWAIIIYLLASSVTWIVLRGDLHSDQWVKSVFFE